MRIGVISDTHDRLANAAAALSLFARQRVGLVIHCGDWKSIACAAFIAERAAVLRLPVRGVLGNNDHDVTGFLRYALAAPGDFGLQEGVLEFVVSGVRVAAYHGHHKPTLNRLRNGTDYDIVLLGHTHKPLVEPLAEKLLVNPGSTAFAIPRKRDWQPSAAIVDTGTRTADILYFADNR
jgi:putative phosphoesterase